MFVFVDDHMLLASGGTGTVYSFLGFFADGTVIGSGVQNADGTPYADLSGVITDVAAWFSSGKADGTGTYSFRDGLLVTTPLLNSQGGAEGFLPPGQVQPSGDILLSDQHPECNNEYGLCEMLYRYVGTVTSGIVSFRASF